VLSYQDCAGGEVRGEFYVFVTLQADDVIVWRPIVHLYEGSTCISRDWDGKFEGRNRVLSPDHYQDAQWIKTWNSAEDTPGDFVRVDYEVHHDV
jgi:hypothetical protein